MTWADATDQSGIYVCKAVSALGSDTVVFEIRIKGEGVDLLLHWSSVLAMCS